jgi:hypothetical protein
VSDWAAALRLLRAAAFAGAIAAQCSWPARAAAAEPAAPPLRLEWHAPAGCPDREHAQAAIAAALGKPLPPRDEPAVVRVQIAQREDGQWNADIWMYGADGSGERSFAGASCAHVADAAALIVAMALDPSAAPERADSDAGAARASLPNETALRFLLGLRVSGGTGSLPEPSAGIALALGVELGRLRAEVDAAAWLPQVARGGLDGEVGGRLGLFTGALRGCFDALRPGGGALRIGACLAFEAGVATGEGIDISDPQTDEHLWAAGLGGLSLRHAGRSPLRLGLLLELGAPLRRPIWEIDDFEVFQAEPVLGRLSLSAGWLFP